MDDFTSLSTFGVCFSVDIYFFRRYLKGLGRLADHIGDDDREHHCGGGAGGSPRGVRSGECARLARGEGPLLPRHSEQDDVDDDDERGERRG